MHELDRILNEEQLSPPTGFAQRVMRMVMQEASTPAPIPFPWRHVFATLAAMVAVVIAWYFLSPVIPSSSAIGTSADLRRTIAGIDPSLFTWGTSVGVAVIGLLRYSVRFIAE